MTTPSPKQRAVTMKRNGMDDSLVGAVLGISADDVRALLYEANPDVELGGGGEDLPVFQTSVDLDYEQMVALPNTPVEILPAPDEGTMWLPFWAFAQMNEEGDFGGWDNTPDEAYLHLVDTAVGNAARRLAPSQFAELDNFFVDGGGLLFVPQTSTWLGVDGNPVGAFLSSIPPVDASGLDAGVSLAIGGWQPQPAPDFIPSDEGGYPDSHMRVTIAYAQIVKFTD